MPGGDVNFAEIELARKLPRDRKIFLDRISDVLECLIFRAAL